MLNSQKHHFLKCKGRILLRTVSDSMWQFLSLTLSIKLWLNLWLFPSSLRIYHYTTIKLPKPLYQGCHDGKANNNLLFQNHPNHKVTHPTSGLSTASAENPGHQCEKLSFEGGKWNAVHIEPLRSSANPCCHQSPLSLSLYVNIVILKYVQTLNWTRR